MLHKYLPLLTALILVLCLHGSDQVPSFSVELANLLQMQQGYGWPPYLHVAEGHEALMRLPNTLANPQTCEVTTPAGVKFDVHHPPSNRYEHWSDGCGLRVRNVVAADEGRWRLTSTSGNGSLTGWSEVDIKARISNYTAGAISLQDGQTHTLVELSSLTNSYCLVAQPFSESSLVPGQCRVTLDRTTRAVQGRWSVLLGLPGQVNELQVDRTVAVEAERLDVGYVRDTEAHRLHLYCNIMHSLKNITFCRFQKSTASSGFNVIDGLSDGRYSYYGEGFARRHCGMTIESVSANDYGTWRCTVGNQERVDNTIHQRTPMQALITVPPREGARIRREYHRSEDEVRTLFVQKDSSLTIMCHAEASLAYCWFQHPNGSQFTPVERQAEGEQDFWYTGENLQTGDCGITFANATEADAGTWTCHMGHKYVLGVEIMDNVAVRVTGPLAARQQEVSVMVGDVATLYCHTSNGPRPLDYCRFLTPNFIGINVDSSVNASNAILNRYHFTEGRHLDYGDCSLTINPVLQEDIGQWTCAALLHDHTMESRDTIQVHYAGNAARMPRLRAGLFGMSAGIVLLGLVMAVVVWYKKGQPILWHRTRSNQTDEISLDTRTTRANHDSRGSLGSRVSASTTSSSEQGNFQLNN